MILAGYTARELPSCDVVGLQAEIHDTHVTVLGILLSAEMDGYDVCVRIRTHGDLVSVLWLRPECTVYVLIPEAFDV